MATLKNVTLARIVKNLRKFRRKPNLSDTVWEGLISLNSDSDILRMNIGSVSQYVDQDDETVDWGRDELPLATAIKNDTSPLPRTEDREGYYGDNHFNYWASGLRDATQIVHWLEAHGITIKTLFDLGCATGRVLRHFHHQGYGYEVIGSDINRRHIDWVCENLPKDVTVFQSTSIPCLPLPDGSIDFVTAFSVFTHVECFDTGWLMEIRRVLKKGGVAWLTVHSERTWRDMTPGWPIYRALKDHPKYQAHREDQELPGERVIYRRHQGRSYSSNVFYTIDYLKRYWGRILDFVEVIPGKPHFQDIVILRKP